MTSIDNIKNHTLKVECHPNLSRDEFRNEFLKKQLPVVIPGGAMNFPAIKKWDNQYLIQKAGDFMVTAKSKTDYGIEGNKRIKEKSVKIPLKQILEYLLEKDAPDLSYVRQTNILADINELALDIIQPDYIPELNTPQKAVTWIGPTNTVAQLHWDSSDNMFVQIRGKKRMVLISPSQSHLTYPNKILLQSVLKYIPLNFIPKGLLQTLEYLISLPNTSMSQLMDSVPNQIIQIMFRELARINNCHVDAETPDGEKYPLFLKADRYFVYLEPGDILFIPNYWRHYVRSLSPSISINWFFQDLEFPGFSTEHVNQIMKRTILEHFMINVDEVPDDI